MSNDNIVTVHPNVVDWERLLKEANDRIRELEVVNEAYVRDMDALLNYCQDMILKANQNGVGLDRMEAAQNRDEIATLRKDNHALTDLIYGQKHEGAKYAASALMQIEEIRAERDRYRECLIELLPRYDTEGKSKAIINRALKGWS